MSHGTLAISTIEPSRPQAAQVAVFGHPPHTPYLNTPVVLPQSSDRSFFMLLSPRRRASFPPHSDPADNRPVRDACQRLTEGRYSPGSSFRLDRSLGWTPAPLCPCLP